MSYCIRYVLHSVYRVKIDDAISESEASNNNNNNEEVILFDKTTTGKTGLDNPVTYYEGPDDLCVWYEPTVVTQIEFNPKTEQNEMVTKVGDLSEIKAHYLYPFNKENIAMIKGLVKNSRHSGGRSSSSCNFYVLDKSTGMTRLVESFEQWASGALQFSISVVRICFSELNVYGL